MDKATSNHAFCSTDTPTSVSLSCAFVLFVVKYSLRPFVSIGVHWCAFVVHILSVISCLSCFSCFSWLNTPSAPSCPFVSIRGSYSFRHFVPFVYFVLFVVHPLLNGRVAELPRGRAHARHPRTAFSSLFPMKKYSCPFVFIRGSYLSAPSWFIFSPSLRVHSWPRRTTAPSKNRPAIFERLSKRFTFLPATRRHRSRMGLPGRPR